MYTNRNFKHKKGLKEAVANHEGVRLMDETLVGSAFRDGECSVEGPHYPAPHTWYARVQVQDGVIVKVLQ